MSYHLPFRGLPQELQEEIYRHALCPSEGIRIDRRHWPVGLEFKCTPSIASALLCTNHNVHEVAARILYGKNCLRRDRACFDALHFLRSLPPERRLQIRNVSLQRRMMWADNGHNRDYVDELADCLIEEMRLQHITLVMPDDMTAGTNGEDRGQYEWFMWTLHEVLIKAFMNGRFHEIRFAHPKIYAEDIHLHDFHNMECHIEHMLLHDYREHMQALRDQSWKSFYAFLDHGTVVHNTLYAVRRYGRNIWQRAGFAIERDSNYGAEKMEGTVLVLRRKATSSSREHEEGVLGPYSQESEE